MVFSVFNCSLSDASANGILNVFHLLVHSPKRRISIQYFHPIQLLTYSFFSFFYSPAPKLSVLINTAGLPVRPSPARLALPIAATAPSPVGQRQSSPYALALSVVSVTVHLLIFVTVHLFIPSFIITY